MTITSPLFEALLKCPTKCWLRAANEPPAGNVYAEWVRTENESYRVAETNRLIAQMPAPGPTLSPPAETLKSAKWLLASDVVVRATGIPRSSRSEKAPSSPSQASQPGIDAGSGGLGNGTPVPSSALGMPDSTFDTSPAHLGAAPQAAGSHWRRRSSTWSVERARFSSRCLKFTYGRIRSGSRRDWLAGGSCWPCGVVKRKNAFPRRG